MGEFHIVERRREPRTPVDVALLVWGVDTQGERFLQEVRARDVSQRGALLSGFDTNVQSGDVIGILYAGRRARFRVIWVRYDGTGDKMQVAVHRVEGDACPWQELLARPDLAWPTAESPPPPAG